jgi:hypothetical protein
MTQAKCWRTRSIEIGFATSARSLGTSLMPPRLRSVKSSHSAEGVLSEARSAGKRTVLLRLKSGDSMRFLTAPVG